MKKDDLLAMGIDEETAKKVMAEHGKTVSTLNAQLGTVTSERDTLQVQIATNQTELNTLKEAAKGNEELSTNFASLQEKFNAAETESKAQLAKQQKDFAIKLALKDTNAHDEGILLKELDHDTIKVTDNGIQGLSEQLASLKESKPFLFQEAAPADPTPKIFTTGNAKGSQANSDDIEAQMIAAMNDN